MHGLPSQFHVLTQSLFQGTEIEMIPMPVFREIDAYVVTKQVHRLVIVGVVQSLDFIVEPVLHKSGNLSIDDWG